MALLIYKIMWESASFWRISMRRKNVTLLVGHNRSSTLMVFASQENVATFSGSPQSLVPRLQIVALCSPQLISHLSLISVLSLICVANFPPHVAYCLLELTLLQVCSTYEE
jgi:hypothetical protein